MAETIETKYLRIANARDVIRAKLVELGLAESSMHLDALAAIVADIVNQGAVSVQIKEGQTYTIPAGFHNGSGTVSGVAGGGEYTLEPTKTVTPTKALQNVTPSDGFYGLEGVTVLPIPAIYQDVSPVTAAAEDVLTGKIIVLANGSTAAGTVPNNGAISGTMNGIDSTEVSVAKGYTSGGKVAFDDTKICEMLDAI